MPRMLFMVCLRHKPWPRCAPGLSSSTDRFHSVGEHATLICLAKQRSSHPIFAGVVFAKNLTDLLGKALVTGRRQQVAELFRLRAIRFLRLSCWFAHRFKAVMDPAFIQGTMST